MEVQDEDEDDYLTMTIAEPTPKIETSLQRKQRLRKEAEERSRPHTKSKAELEAEEKAAREKAQDDAIDQTNKGFKLLSKLGYKPGNALGKEGNENARTEPIRLAEKGDRGGVGMEEEKKRKIREQAAANEELRESEAKRQKVDEVDYRVRVAREKEEKRKEVQMWGAMSVAERLDEEKEKEEESKANGDEDSAMRPTGKAAEKWRSLRSFPVIWRGLVKRRREKDRNEQARILMHQSRNADSDSDDPYDHSLGDDAPDKETDLQQEDEELDTFNALEIDDRLTKTVAYLREKHHYCFWCKMQYPDAEMEGCPGPTEEDHD